MVKEFYDPDFIRFLEKFGEAGKLLREIRPDKHIDFLPKAKEQGLDEKAIAAIESGENRDSGLLLGYAKSLGFPSLPDVIAAASISASVQSWRTELAVDYFSPGTALRRLRVALGMSQQQFSIAAEVSPQTLSALENHHNNIGDSEYSRVWRSVLGGLARTMNVKPDKKIPPKDELLRLVNTYLDTGKICQPDVSDYREM